MTERHLSACFVEALSRDLSALSASRPAVLATEVTVRQGIADAVLGGGNAAMLGDRGIAAALGSYTNAKVLSLLGRAPRSLDYLRRESQIPGWRLSRALQALESAGLVEKESSGADTFAMAGRLCFEGPLLWAFELKLQLNRRALFQALQYRTFAHRVAIVVPKRLHLLESTKVPQLRKLGIGLFTVDLDTGEVESILRGQAHRPFSRFHHFYALGRVLDTATFL